MKIVFLSGSRSSAAGGIFEVERAIADQLRNRHNLIVEAGGLYDDGIERDAIAWGSTPVHCFPIVGPKSFGYSPGLRKWMLESDHDLLHLHNLWMYTSVIAQLWSSKKKRPYIVSPHGMLDPWALKNSGWKKRLVELMYERRMLRDATVIHAFHDKDVGDYRNYGLVNPIAVIPNGVSLPRIRPKRLACQKRLLFLGRIHPKKGLIELIEAWKAISVERDTDWKLAIAGWGDDHYITELKNRISSLGLGSSIEFLGPIYGESKQDAFESASGFILPSRSEGLPMAVLEAWSYSVPVLMTDMCNLPQGFQASAAIRITHTVQGIQEGLRTFLCLSDEERIRIGCNGRTLVEEQFTWESVADRFLSVYQWMLGATAPPSCLDMAATSTTSKHSKIQ